MDFAWWLELGEPEDLVKALQETARKTKSRAEQLAVTTACSAGCTDVAQRHFDRVKAIEALIECSTEPELCDCPDCEAVTAKALRS